MRLFLQQEETGHHDTHLGTTRHDTIVCEMAFKYGRADVVVFHKNGSATVIEAKDGSKGYNHVVSGLGQASLYAAQLSIAKGAVRAVRKALMWTSTGDAWCDALIEWACRDANTISLPWPAMPVLMKNEAEIMALFERAES